jgi:hypothetical protein
MPYASFFSRNIVLALALISALTWLFWNEIEVPRRRAAVIEAIILAVQADPLLHQAIRSQNLELAQMDQAGIDQLDAKWMDEKSKGGGSLIAAYLAHPVSQHLRTYLSKSGTMIRHAILMDNKGRNVGVAAVTSDYFQGDEAKWLETFARPVTTRHVSDLERGHEGNFVARWISAPIWDEASKEPLGAIALEYDVNASIPFSVSN